ncbi:MAG TPA: Crp/Fnr family transcriptional regulator [Anaerolineales bacterium]|nr:Crp/Fnr family transcriptional regulator [Anaerolineales bacterium]
MNKSELQEFIASQSLFQSLTPAEIDFLVTNGVIRAFLADAIVTHAGDPWDRFIIVLSGTINAEKTSSEGRNLWITELNKGDVFWGFAFFEQGQPMPVTLFAGSDARLLILGKETIRALIEKNGKFAWDMLRQMAKSMARASAIVEGLAFQPVASRVANFLLDKYPPEQVNFPRDLTLDEIAARAGTTREMVCRSLQRFASDGTIDITRTELRIRDRTKLENYILLNETGK